MSNSLVYLGALVTVTFAVLALRAMDKDYTFVEMRVNAGGDAEVVFRKKDILLELKHRPPCLLYR